jgi:hypothetical protein
MNRLSAIDSFARVRAMLFNPFRLAAWLKIGLIGLLGAIVSSGGSSFRTPVMPRNVPHNDLPPNAEDILRAIRSIHLADYFHVFVIVIAVIVVLALIFSLPVLPLPFHLVRFGGYRAAGHRARMAHVRVAGQSLFRVLAGVPAGHVGSVVPDRGRALMEGLQERHFQR